MQTLRNKLIGLAAIGVLAVIGALMNSRQAVAQNPNPGSAPVNIVSPLPLPVTGSTTVSGSVAATQSGAWSVGITGQPIGVNVNNSPLVVLPTHLGVPASNIVRLANRLANSSTTCPAMGQSFTAETFCQIRPDGTFVSTPFVIPANHYFVITDVSFFASVAANTSVSMGLFLGSSVIYELSGVGNPGGEASAHDHLTSGIVVSTMPSTEPSPYVLLSGYLVP